MSRTRARRAPRDTFINPLHRGLDCAPHPGADILPDLPGPGIDVDEAAVDDQQLAR
jgi:hypothetical protein